MRRCLRRLGLGVLLAMALGGSGRAGEFADSDAGGPDFWRIEGLKPGATLTLREAPGRDARAITWLTADTRLANLGCRRSSAGRWCKVRTDAGATGFVAGRFLRE